MGGQRPSDRRRNRKKWTLRAHGDSGHLSQQTLIGNLQPVVQALDHAQAERPLAAQHLGYPPTRTDERLQVTRRQSVLLHAELDGFHRVGGSEVVVLVFVGLNERHQDIAIVRLCTALLGPEDLLEAAKSPLKVNGTDLTCYA